MKTLELSKATAPLAKYAERVDKEAVIVTDHGRPIAALVALVNTDRETARLSTNVQFLALIERSRARQKRAGSLSSVELRKRLGHANKDR